MNPGAIQERETYTAEDGTKYQKVGEDWFTTEELHRFGEVGGVWGNLELDKDDKTLALPEDIKKKREEMQERCRAAMMHYMMTAPV